MTIPINEKTVPSLVASVENILALAETPATRPEVEKAVREALREANASQTEKQS